jgi:hypothetical protein
MLMGTKGKTSPVNVQAISPQRPARRAIPATLEQVCEDLDKQSKEGSSAGRAS